MHWLSVEKLCVVFLAGFCVVKINATAGMSAGLT